MINKAPPFKGLNIRIPLIIPIKGRGFINRGSALGFRVSQHETPKEAKRLLCCRGMAWASELIVRILYLCMDYGFRVYRGLEGLGV